MGERRRALTRFVERHRRGLSALLAASAVVCLGLALRPPRVVTVPVVVAAHALPTGHRIVPADLRQVDVAAQVAPPASAAGAPDLVLGRVLGAPVAAGEPISPLRLVDSASSAWRAESDASPLPVRFADAGAVDLLDAGQRIDVLATDQSGEVAGGEPIARLVAEGVLVLGVVRPEPVSDGTGLLSGGSASTDSSPADASDLVVLAASRAQALGIAGAEAGSRLSFALADRPATLEEADP